MAGSQRPRHEHDQPTVAAQSRSAEEVPGPDGSPELLISVSTYGEKGSDVNVVSHLLIDVLTDQVDAALVFSNDSDLRFPLETARCQQTCTQTRRCRTLQPYHPVLATGGPGLFVLLTACLG